MKFSLFVLLLSAVLVPHDYFISILTIRHNGEQQTLDLTWQITAHDLEHALSNVAELKLNSAQEHPKADSLINAYFVDHLHLTLENIPLNWRWVGREMEGENLFCYLEVDSVKDPDGMSVSNSLLQDVFMEQDNIVHMESGGQVISHHFLMGNGMRTFDLE